MKRPRLSPTKTLLLGYCLMILVGAALLCLPFATRSGRPDSFLDACFTAASATCVTGLIRFDTFTHWSLFGQIVLLFLIQIGGIGFMTLIGAVLSLTRMKFGLSSRVLLQESVSAPQVGGIVRMVKFIVAGSLLIEGVGALLLAFAFCPRFGWLRGIYFAIFHAVSAFCNAGFDLMGSVEPFSSLTIVGGWYVCGVLMALIILGGLGFFVWQDLLRNRFRFSRLRLHSKLVLVASGVLVFGGAALLFLLELGQGDGSISDRILGALFQSVTARTAGFNSVSLPGMTQASLLVMICLMLIGGSPGSTAGGMKTTTFTVLALSIFSTFRRKRSIEVFGRRTEETALHKAACVFSLYLFFALGAALVISRLDGLPILTALFESVSAVATVGLTLGVTPSLCAVSELLLTLLMLFGRVGSITMLLAFARDRDSGAAARLPVEKIQIG